MNRRNLMMGAGAAAAAAAVSFAKTVHAAEPEAKKGGGSVNAKLVAATADCIGKGELCLAHNIQMLEGGDKSMGPCARSVREMLAVCRALEAFAASGSSHTKELAQLTARICKECEAECRKHDKHPPCKECGDSCAACAAECNKAT